MWFLRPLLDKNFPHKWHSTWAYPKTFSLLFLSFCWFGASWDRPVLVFWVNHPQPSELEENFCSMGMSMAWRGVFESANERRLEGGDTAGEVLLTTSSIGKLRFQRRSWMKQWRKICLTSYCQPELRQVAELIVWGRWTNLHPSSWSCPRQEESSRIPCTDTVSLSLP